jgi:hypothetical protein
VRSDFRGEIEIWIGDAVLRQVSEARLTAASPGPHDMSSPWMYWLTKFSAASVTSYL